MTLEMRSQDQYEAQAGAGACKSRAQQFALTLCLPML